MTRVVHRYLVCESGALRHVSEYVYDPRDLDKDGKPPGWFLPQGEPVIAEPGEIEFDHVPTQIEIALAFVKKADEEKRNEPSDEKQ